MAALSFAQLQQLCSSPALDGQQLRSLYDTIFMPRFIRVSGTALTLTDEHRGAWILLTNASTVTITLPTLSAGILVSITPLGAGGASLSGTHLGGTTISQNGLATLATLDDGSWFVTGAV
ncbi:hypothetical protein FHX10_003429 [Rhizobium sp. BK591]|uniref:hypothetical protein n=1 Tax=Rhizobium sp. BK591 TaxID=2586985 RepID=UPI001615E1EA|nr:hypothetical protein [Rhizobium sp. BK591]MBB3743930.1 hypothetical protein [Rhizobium sp. BK591]